MFCYKTDRITPVTNNIVKLFIILLLLQCSGFVYAQQEKIPVHLLTDMYNAIKAGKLALLEDKEIHIRSEKEGNTLKADIYAITQHRFADLHKALSTPRNWCEFIPLHINIKSCTCSRGPKPTITFYAGRKFYQPPEKAYELKYQFQVTEKGTDRFRVQLTAEEGPLGTSSYIIVLEAILLDSETLVHLGLSYETSITSRLATQTYLSTIGKNKVGFSIAEQKASNPVSVKGVSGIIERNVMRYFLALSVYLDTLNLDSANRFIQRAESWYELTERYATQLHELEKQEYIEAKQQEYLNQQWMQRQINLEFEQHGPGTSGD
jgi:hypothetical protein